VPDSIGYIRIFDYNKFVYSCASILGWVVLQLGNFFFKDSLPLNGDLNILGQYDYFHGTGFDNSKPQGSRYHFNPILSFPQTAPWGIFHAFC